MPERTRAGAATGVKICGLTHPDDARHAAAAGAAYLGAILSAGFGRSVAPAVARDFGAAGTARLVAVVVDEPAPSAARLARAAGASVLQLHGEETPATLAALRDEGDWTLWKAVRPRSSGELLAALERWAGHADALLVDGWHAALPGGSGAPFPGELVFEALAAWPRGLGLVAAGGLGPDNVADVVARLAPDVVDVSSGVESEPGRKDPARVEAFIRAAQGVVGSGEAR